MTQPTLLIMAAGIGSRYGGTKQLDQFGAEYSGRAEVTRLTKERDELRALSGELRDALEGLGRPYFREGCACAACKEALASLAHAKEVLGE